MSKLEILETLVEKTQEQRNERLKKFMYINEVRNGRYGSNNATNVPTSGTFGPKPSGTFGPKPSSSNSGKKIFEPQSTGLKGFSQELATAAFHTAFPGLVPLHRMIVKHFLTKSLQQKKSSNANPNNAPPSVHPITKAMSTASSQGVPHPMASKMSNFGSTGPKSSDMASKMSGSTGPKSSNDNTSALIQKLVQKLPSSNGPIPSMFNLNQKPKPHFKMNTNGSINKASSNPRTP